MSADTTGQPSCPFAFGPRALGVYLAYMGALVPLATCMYLPALPIIAADFQASPELISWSLSLFTLFFALSMLFWGPCSDRRGRKFVLCVGLLAYIVIGIGLALCDSAAQLIVGRCVQAMASGSASAMSLAIIKDSFKGRTMENMMGTVQAMIALAPVLAPVIGGLLLHFFHWRGIFWTLTGCGILGLALLPALRETAPPGRREEAVSSLGRLRRVLARREFTVPLLLLSLSNVPLLTFLASSAYIYENFFGLTPQQFSLFYAFNSVWSVLGPIVYLRWLRRLPRRRFFEGAFLVMALCGGLLLSVDPRGPVLFALMFAPATLCVMALRAASAILLMGRVPQDAGTVSSLIGSTGLLFGALGMMACSLPWPDFITAVGSMTLGVGLVSLSGWLALGRDDRPAR